MISDSLYQYISLDLPAMLTATFAAICCALLGNFLVLRRLSLMGDAISHSVLPGIVIAFLITGSRASFPIFIGAAIAGIVTAVLVEIIKRLGRLDSGASMGVIFSLLFALGVLLIEQAAARSVDLDADCLLHGQLEAIFWFPDRDALFSLATLSQLPNEVITTFTVMILTIFFIVLFFKELKIAAFDPALATALGFNSTALHFILMIFVAGAVVASFEAVGSILVIAMIVCPPATARLLTDNMKTQLWLSVVFATISGVGGYLSAAFLPPLIGFGTAVNAAGMITIVAGTLMLLFIIAAPQYGLFAKSLRKFRLAVQISREDILGMLYRLEEIASRTQDRTAISREQALEAIGGNQAARIALRKATSLGQLKNTSNGLTLTEEGRKIARSLVRTHRLWETYLVQRLGLRPDHVHDTAMELEHFTSDRLQDHLAQNVEDTAVDPQGKRIPSSPDNK